MSQFSAHGITAISSDTIMDALTDYARILMDSLHFQAAVFMAHVCKAKNSTSTQYSC